MQFYATSGCTNFDLNFNPDWLSINIFLNPNQKVRKMFYYGRNTTIYSQFSRGKSNYEGKLPFKNVSVKNPWFQCIHRVLNMCGTSNI